MAAFSPTGGTGFVGAAVGRGLEAGYLAAEGVDTMTGLSLGARVAIRAGTMGTEIVGNSIGQTVATAGQPGAGTFTDALIDNTIFTLGWIERSRSERDGRPVITLQERGQGWAVEITLDADGDVRDVVALSPERAQELEQ